jgi:hypothetical protein
MLFTVYALIGSICFVTFWLARRMRTHTDSQKGALPPQSALFWIALSLPMVSSLIMILVMILLQEYQYLPGVLMLGVTVLLLVMKAPRQR